MGSELMMQPEPRAILFDLDDTLYPRRYFVRSGFVACAEYLDRELGLNPRVVLSMLLGASVGPDQGRELQVCAARFGLTTAVVTTLIEVIRQHAPSLILPQSSREALAALHVGWRLGVVSCGFPDLQERKACALGLPLVVDTIVYANALSDDDRGKPQTEPFIEAARRLRVIPERIVFVANHLRCDVSGAVQVGMRTVHVQGEHTGRAAERNFMADVTISSLGELPMVVEPLVPEYRSADVA
jgi:putative hydrolase of the HAD superfamily